MIGLELLGVFVGLARDADRRGLAEPVTCGVVGEVIEMATPPLSISSSVFCTDQLDSVGPCAR